MPHNNDHENYYILRLTHLKKLDAKDATKVISVLDGIGGENASKKTFMARAMDCFDNVYYVTMVLLHNGHGVFIATDPQLHRSCIQMLPHTQEFIDSGLIITMHPPLCTQCWKTETEIGTIINHFRDALSKEAKLPEKSCSVDIAPKFREFLKISHEEIIGDLSGMDAPIVKLLTKNGKNFN